MSSRLILSTRTHCGQVLYWYLSFCSSRKEKCHLILNPYPKIQLKSPKFLNYTNAPTGSRLATNKKNTNSLEIKIKKNKKESKKSENKLTLKFYQFNEWDRWKDRESNQKSSTKKNQYVDFELYRIAIKAYEFWKVVWVW